MILSPQCNPQGTFVCTTVNGECYMDTFYCENIGVYYVSVWAAGFSNYSYYFNVTKNDSAPAKILIQSSSSPSANFDFLITVMIVDISSNLCRFNCLFTLSSIGGQSALMSNSSLNQFGIGSVTFNVWFNDYGSQTIIATCSGKSENITIYVLPETLTVKSANFYVKLI